ncbi:MAG: DEAD/DEAH box helicase [Desulfocapsa sp.]|nr:DEAD/DEAH box helicase [Desulfocapsa sp.]
MKHITLHHSPAFQKKYNSLSPEQQNFLKMLSICYEKVARSKVRTCLAEAGIKNDRGLVFKQTDIKPIVNALEAAGFIEGDNMGISCRSDYVEELTCQAVFDNTFEKMAQAVETVIPTKCDWEYEHYYSSYAQAIRDLRFTLYRGQQRSTVIKFLNYASRVPCNYYEQREDPFFLIFCNPINRSLLLYIQPEVADLVLSGMLVASSFTMTPLGGFFDLFQEVRNKNAALKEQTKPVLLYQYVLRGDFAAVTALAQEEKTASDSIYMGLTKLMAGDHRGAITCYESALSTLAAHQPKPQVFFQNFAGIFYVVALLCEGSDAALQKGITYLNRILLRKREYTFPTIATDLKQTLLSRLGQKAKAGKISHSSDEGFFNDYLALMMGYVSLYWQGEKVSSIGEEHLQKLLKESESAEYYWIALQAAGLLASISTRAEHTKALTRLQKQCSSPQLLIDLIKPQEKWQQVLNALITLEGSQQTGKTSAATKSRLVWLVAFLDDYHHEEIRISPRLQTQNKSGKWSKGRAVALKTLRNHQKLDYPSDHDRRLCNAIKAKYDSSGYYYSRKKIYAFDLELAIPALIDHPLIFSEDKPTLPLEFVSREPQLHITESKKGYTISLEPNMRSDEPYLLVHETLTRTGVVQMTPGFKQVADIIDSTIEVPAEAKEMVLRVVSAMAPRLAVHTDIAGIAPDVQEAKADTTPYFHLIPYGDGLRAESLVKPFQESPAFHHPGTGGKIVLAEINGEKFQAERDLETERQQADAAIAKCPVLSRLNEGSGDWIIAEPEECLELVSQLQTLQDEVVIQWPQGETFRVSSTVESSAFGMQVKQNNNWFEATGQLKVDAKTVIDMGKLLELSRQTPSRFIPMGDGQFLALSRSLRQRIEELNSFTETHGKGVRFSPLASLALEDFTTEMGEIKGDKPWRENLKRFTEFASPKVPSTFQAELRDYQTAGFNWLATLSQWQVGACLADDMGLGKTVQALAAILLRAANGPTLVIAPTSVLMNWTDEAARFAPTLRVLAFGPGDRQEMLDTLQPFDLVVSSYGLLQSEGKKLAGVHWQTIVLDEAQAIKNMATKRSKAAMKLQAEFRIITTGTPIENHLGELWNLFQFINPGLLGSAESFNQKFAIPIEKYQDRQTRGRLKKLLSPFILRRLKQDVLQELPPRTEMTLQIEMSPEEAAMYEAQRRQSLEKIAEIEETGSGQHMQILAEITRLRRFCCNPELVVPGCGLTSSKLKVFGDTISELLDNGHKALVFSQFVGHLDILRHALDKQKVSYQYLDGSTPLKTRQQRIRAFQSGEGDVFLISLKAGGAGLNLTAADYVIHMDPWWNPAVEDQASDRAHRIGQKRPVTVYRLVVKDSIEEKIIALHAHKRDLADSLLEGTDMSGKVSTKQLLELMKG